MTMRVLLAFLAGCVAACGGDGGSGAPGSGDLSIDATFEPDPPVVGRNTVHIGLTDTEGQPVDGATVTVDAQMPAHGHGSSEEAVVEAQGDGRYDAFPVTLTMPGGWVVTVVATEGERTGERAFEVEAQ